MRKPSDSVKETFPEQNGQSRDLAGKRVGVSGKAIDKERQHAGVNQHTKSLRATLPQGSQVPGKSRDFAAKRVGVGGKAIDKVAGWHAGKAGKIRRRYSARLAYPIRQREATFLKRK